MDIKKISEKEVRIILNKTDMEEKNIDIRAILRGSSSAKDALNSLIYEAIEKVNLQIDNKNKFLSLDIPFANEESIELVLTVLDISSRSELEALQSLSNLFKNLGYEYDFLSELGEFDKEISKQLKSYSDTFKSDVKSENYTRSSKSSKTTKSTKISSKIRPLIYSFDCIEYLVKVTQLFINNKITFNESKLYKKDKKYFLSLTKKTTTKMERAEAILSEYGTKVNCHEYVLEEHGELMIKENALKILNEYF